MKPNQLLPAILVVASLCQTLHAQTVVQGDVSGTWTTAGSPYIVIGEATVPSGQTLTIDPGVTVQFALGVSLTVDGVLSAVGTSTDSIRFTTAEPGPSPGQWKRLYFTNTGPYPASVLEYCIVEYGGSGNTYAITMSSPSVKLQIGHSLIRRNSYGVYLLGSNASVSHSIIQEQTQYGIYGGGGATIQACTVTNNGSYGIYGQPASIEGCTVTNNGSHGIYLLSTSTGTSIKSTTIQGNSGHGLYLNQSSATVDSCTISGNSNTGINIRAYRSSIFSLTARRNVIYGNGDAGIVLYSASSTIEHNTIVGNGNGGITNIGSNSNVLIRNNIIANNTGNGLHTTVSPAPTTKFNDVFGNTTDYSGFSSLYGNYLTTNRNGDPADVYSNIGLDPVFVDPPGRDYHLQSTSHLIDAGDTLSTNDPDETIADIGAHFYNQSVAISLSTTLVEFGAVDIGTSQTGAFTVSASGAEDLIVSNITSNNPEFSASPTSFTVVPGGSQSVALTFLPSTVGEREALITVVNNSPIDPNKTLRATGFGVDTLAPAPPQNLTAVAGEGQVSLTWNQNTEPDFLRYRIYGGTAQNPTTSIDSTTSATDTTKTVSGLTNDTIYYFRVTALNLGLRESAFSNEVNATPISPNQAPGVFFLIDPGDSTAIVITEVELMDTLRFRWSAAKDPDGDNVLYIATIDGRTVETSDTTIGIPYSVFTDSMQAIGETVSAGYWTVAATDGQNTTWAENGPFTFTIDISQIEVLPQITFIIDVPDDQGRQVYLNWSASGLDSPGGITQYSIKLLNPENSWVSLGTVTAEQDSAYTYLAATFGDSSAYDTVWSRFQVTAHTSNPAIYYTSPVDSGYSIDNLAPAAPTGLVASMTEGPAVSLAWNGPVDYDFGFFRVYRQPSVDTVATAIAETYDPTFTDTTAEGGESYHYWISALDVNGNESGNSQPVLLTVLGLEGAPGLPAEFALHPNYPNPFNPGTTISYDLPQPGPVALVVYDLRGREVARLVEGQREAGYHQVTWAGRDTAGREVPTGIYIARLSAQAYTKSIKMVLLK